MSLLCRCGRTYAAVRVVPSGTARALAGTFLLTAVLLTGVAGANATERGDGRDAAPHLSHVAPPIRLPSAPDPFEELKQHTVAFPEDADGWFRLGLAYMTARSYESAIDAFSRSIDLRRDEQALYQRGLAYSFAGASDRTLYTKAIADARAALVLKPHDPDAQLLKADAEYGAKDYAAATDDYLLYVALPAITADSRAYARKQSLHAAIDNKDYPRVIALTTDRIAADPTDAVNYQLRAAIYVAMKNYDAALLDLTRCTGIKPDDDWGFVNLGNVYVQKEDHEKAAVAFEKALRLNPLSYAAANNAALAHKSLAHTAHDDSTVATEYEKAAVLFDKAATIKGSGPEAIDALYNEGDALEAEAGPNHDASVRRQAVAVWKRFLSLAPEDARVGEVRKRMAGDV